MRYSPSCKEPKRCRLMIRLQVVTEMTLERAAALLGVKADYLRNALRRGSLKGEKHGGVWFVTPEEVERYATENKGNRGRPSKQ